MRFLTHQDGIPPALVAPTLRVGSIMMSRERAIELLGLPIEHLSLDSEVSREWHLLFADGTVATVYDWHRSAAQSPKGMPVTFHIGGMSRVAADRVHEAFRAQFMWRPQDSAPTWHIPERPIHPSLMLVHSDSEGGHAD